MGHMWSQNFPPTPSFTETSLPDLHGRVYIVTGGSGGLGKELTSLLYSRNATVYLAARSKAKTLDAIHWVQEQSPKSTGKLHFLHLDLNDLTTIKASAQEFLSKETRLDVLFNNAGIMMPPSGTLTAQNFDAELGVNCYAPFFFTKLLTPLLLETAKRVIDASVRVVWVSSSAAELLAPKGGLDLGNLDYKIDKNKQTRYSISKAGNVLHAFEFARRYRDQGVVSVALHPGMLKTELSRDVHPVVRWMMSWVLYPAVNGAYTELFAGFAPQVAGLRKGEWVIPFGRVATIKHDIANGEKAEEWWEWCENIVEKYE